mmetsp:Transcript_98283/g.204990  ORF Transcript_98283/g.204990 Transcript_98283/m.204990 type:complete len:391 (+) Transcript_98283:143-1315(+)|eukprot:CAMPEP_0206469008 /NCGR_PEP_ID=MMETSP0324_2-20121206/29997_1 /ASSEMBLY_ACC=CAM_ASM_000836 /TAXON_ID=2866 /ORGANISM="Crypthecodinium cohnii, Strain Seligo" /LENGTH=390 /DNA_ID=CAMNT_0053942631 /DNA_START=79 /DNA_END=1251 /DNA_ORIENTATION=-
MSESSKPMVENQRRRLTVGRGHGSAPDEALAALAAAPNGRIEEFGLQNIFEQAATQGKRAAALFSVTDKDMKRKRSFAEKDEEVLFNSLFSDEKACKDWVHDNRVAYKCHKGLKPESPNQDSFSIVIVEDDFALYSVLDGHGPLGHDVSDLCRGRVVKEFMQRREQGLPPPDALKGAFESNQQELEVLNDSKRLDSSMSGTTCTVAYHDIAGKVLYLAHVGDSRAIISAAGNHREVEDLSVDHKPNLPEEKRRIESKGGRVVFDGFYNHRVFAQAGMYPGLNMSRALGDVIGHHEAGLSAEPDVKEVPLTSEGCPRLLLLCTDGVWEFIESKDAMRLALSGKTPSDISPEDMNKHLSRITKASWDQWMQDSDQEISDDITGIAVAITCVD